MRTLPLVLAASGFALLWARTTTIGPVVFTIHGGLGLGVHTGDLIGLLPLCAVLAYTVGGQYRAASVPSEAAR